MSIVSFVIALGIYLITDVSHLNESQKFASFVTGLEYTNVVFLILSGVITLLIAFDNIASKKNDDTFWRLTVALLGSYAIAVFACDGLLSTYNVETGFDSGKIAVAIVFYVISIFTIYVWQTTEEKEVKEPTAEE